MNKEFIPYEEALSLKELGFNEPCLAYWYNETPRNPEGQCIVYYKKPWDEQKIINGIIRDYYVAPTFSQAFRWFRKKYFKMSYVYYDVEYKFCFCIGYNDKTKGFNTYEEAELACLKELIELVKNK